MKTLKNSCLVAIAILSISTSCFSQEPQHTGCNNVRLITINSPASIGMVRNAVSHPQTTKTKSALNNTENGNTPVKKNVADNSAAPAHNNDADYDKLAYNTGTQSIH